MISWLVRKAWFREETPARRHKFALVLLASLLIYLSYLLASKEMGWEPSPDGSVPVLSVSELLARTLLLTLIAAIAGALASFPVYFCIAPENRSKYKTLRNTFAIGLLLLLLRVVIKQYNLLHFIM